MPPLVYGSAAGSRPPLNERLSHRAHSNPMGMTLRAGGPAFESRRDHNSGCPALALFVFSLMTSFPKRLGTSFTLPRERSERGGEHGVEDDGCSRTARSVCSGGQSGRKILDGFVPGVRHLTADGQVVEAALPTSRASGDRGAESQATSQPVAHDQRVGAAGGGGAAALSRLGSTQVASAIGTGRRGANNVGDRRDVCLISCLRKHGGCSVCARISSFGWGVGRFFGFR